MSLVYFLIANAYPRSYPADNPFLNSSARLLIQDFDVDKPMADFQYGESITAKLLIKEEFGQKCSPGEECDYFTCTRHASPFLVTMLYLSTVSIMKLLARKPPGEEGGEEEVKLLEAMEKMKRLLLKMRERWLLGSEYFAPFLILFLFF